MGGRTWLRWLQITASVAVIVVMGYGSFVSRFPNDVEVSVLLLAVALGLFLYLEFEDRAGGE